MDVSTKLNALNASTTWDQATEARAAYDALSEELKTYISISAYAKLTNAEETISKPVIKKDQIITVTKTVKTAKCGKTTSAIKVNGAKGVTVFQKIGGSKFLDVTKAGKIKISKKAKQNKTYTTKVKVYAKETETYNPSEEKTVSIKVKVK